MKRKSLLLIILFVTGFAGNVKSQGSYLSGNTIVATGATEYYEAHFEYPLHPFTMVSWTVNGGTIIASGINPTSTVYCIVEWSQTPGTGYIEVYEDLGSQMASLNILIGGVANIAPVSQTVSYGFSPAPVCADFGGIPVLSFNWEESTDGVNWTYISSAPDCYQPPSATQTKYYRCYLETQGGYYYTPVASVTIPSLSPGIITASNSQPGYNAFVSIFNTAADGGFCNPVNYQYIWEQAFEGGSWVVIGTGQNYPLTSVQVNGRILIRRKITCGAETLYSNTLVLEPSYIAVDWENRNYIREISVIKKGITSYYQADQLQVGDKLQSTTYLDGIGRAIQSVNKEEGQFAAGTWGDIVTHIEYDRAGRTEKSFIPYLSQTTLGKFKSNALIEQENFVRNKYGEDPNAPTYTQIIYEQSPLSRVLTVKAPGSGFGGDVNYTGVVQQYEFNTLNEGIRIWNVNFTSGSVPYSNTTYPTGRLTKSVTLDEKGKKVYVYTDFEGKVILKKVQDKELGQGLDENSHAGWLSTYYVYDDLGQLRSIITPKAVKYLESTGWVFVSTEVYQELCFWYEFDERGRTVKKHSPGAGEIHLIFDKKDRLVLSQDQNQRNRLSKQWSFYLYDKFDRTVVTGLFDNNNNREVMATHISSLNSGVVSITVYAGASETISADNPVAGNSSYCNACSNTVINSVQYYDGYNYPGVKSFNSGFSFASSSDPDVEATQTSPRTTGFVTGSKTRVIDQNFDDNNPYNDIFLIATSYYDDKGRLIQSLSDNIKSALDYSTIQYNYSGRTLGICDRHTMPGTSVTSFETISKLEYDRIGRISIFSKKFGNLAYKKLAQYTYDEYGRVKNKKLSPDFNSGAGIEDLTYSFNIQGWLTGINKDYALANTALNQWDHYFGMYLGYENRDIIFTNKQYNGNLTGVIWKTQGDNMPRRYDYDYDNANRFTKALFVQKTKPTDASWNGNSMNFSVTDILYDENSNLKQMYQKGMIPGNNSPVYVDRLSYEYKQVAGAEWSNQLRRVYDQPDLTSSNNGSLGDFKDETFGINGEDYLFDGNGNLLTDNNKKIRNGGGNGVVYNFMDKPQKVTIENKSVIDFIYDASGIKLGKKVTYTITGVSKTTWYMGDFIYEETSGQTQLTMILHEEGRIRVYTPVSNPRIVQGGIFDLPDSKKGAFDFFVKDNLQNTRMVLTEETHTEFNDCSMETANSFYEERMFGQVDANGNPVTSTNEVIQSRRDRLTVAPGWNTNGTEKVSRLKQEDQKVGPNIILKVMAGDEINAYTNYYYTGTVDNAGNGNMLGPILSSMLSALSNTAPTGPLHGSAGNITTNYSINPGEFGSFIAGQNNPFSATPQAYMNVLFFDENFNFVPYDNVTGLGSYGWRVTTPGDGTHDGLMASNVKAPKNGYAFVYLSNDSKTPVFFDNFAVTHVRGRIIEENAYYPYGLKIKGISARAFDKQDNRYGYQGDFSEEEEETGWNEFDLRMYDPQIGRWTGVDPYDEFPSPYVGMGCNPINFIDENGGEIGAGGWGALIGTAIGFAIPHIIDAFNGKDRKIKDKFWWGFATSFFTSGIGYSIGEHFWGNNGPIFANFRGFYGGMFGDDEVKYKYWSDHNCPQFDYLPTADFNLNLVGPETYSEEYDKWKTIFRWTANMANTFITFINIDGFRIPVWNIPIPLGPPDFDPNDKENYQIHYDQPPDQYYADPGDPNTIRRGVPGGREYQIRVIDPNGRDLGVMPDETGANRGDQLKVLPLIYKKDYERLKRKNGNSNFLKNRLRNFKFGYKIRKRYIYRKVYRKFFGIKIRIRKECLNCDD